MGDLCVVVVGGGSRRERQGVHATCHGVACGGAPVCSWRGPCREGGRIYHWLCASLLKAGPLTRTADRNHSARQTATQCCCGSVCTPLSVCVCVGGGGVEGSLHGGRKRLQNL